MGRGGGGGVGGGGGNNIRFDTKPTNPSKKLGFTLAFKTLKDGGCLGWKRGWRVDRGKRRE